MLLYVEHNALKQKQNLLIYWTFFPDRHRHFSLCFITRKMYCIKNFFCSFQWGPLMGCFSTFRSKIYRYSSERKFSMLDFVSVFERFRNYKELILCSYNCRKIELIIKEILPAERHIKKKISKRLPTWFCSDVWRRWLWADTIWQNTCPSKRKPTRSRKDRARKLGA